MPEEDSVIAFVYARVSTKDKGQEVENQLIDMRKFAERQEWTLEHEYIDHETGSVSDREQFQAMLLACSQRKADVVLFWSLDRLSREGAFPTMKYLEQLTAWGLSFRSYTEPYLDTCGIFRDVVIAMLATLAKQERIRLGERVKAGMERARAQGKRFGRPRVKADRRQILGWRKAGLSLRTIARQADISEASVRRLLESPGRPRQKGGKKAV
jgi:DNA invertase Pin-like site-specific DNA recombinase